VVVDGQLLNTTAPSYWLLGVDGNSDNLACNVEVDQRGQFGRCSAETCLSGPEIEDVQDKIAEQCAKALGVEKGKVRARPRRGKAL
jgi:hypothetical protein